MLVSIKEILADAKKNHYAIPAFDVSNYEMMKAIQEAYWISKKKSSNKKPKKK